METTGENSKLARHENRVWQFRMRKFDAFSFMLIHKYDILKAIVNRIVRYKSSVRNKYHSKSVSRNKIAIGKCRMWRVFTGSLIIRPNFIAFSMLIYSVILIAFSVYKINGFVYLIVLPFAEIIGHIGIECKNNLLRRIFLDFFLYIPIAVYIRNGKFVPFKFYWFRFYDYLTFLSYARKS